AAAVDKKIVEASGLNAPALKSDIQVLTTRKGLIDQNIANAREDLKKMNDAVTQAQTEIAKPLPDVKGLGAGAGRVKALTENKTILALKDNLSTLFTAASKLHKAMAA